MEKHFGYGMVDKKDSAVRYFRSSQHETACELIQFYNEEYSENGPYRIVELIFKDESREKVKS